jgi:hypothetical protein
MSHEAEAVLQAIDRWEEGGLIDPATATKLRTESEEAASAGTRRLSQYVLAATGGVILLIAGGVFLSWTWPLLGEAARTMVLGISAVGVLVLGVRFENSHRWLPVSYLMQTSALGLLLTAFIYSERAWSDTSAGGFVMGVLSLGVPIVLAPRSMRRSVVMPAVHLAMGLGFLAVFLDRATGLSGDAIVWVLDAVLLASALVLMRTVKSDLAGERHPWALNAFVMAMLAGFVLITITAIGPLSLDDEAVLPLDLWLGISVVLAVWGVRHDAEGLRREIFGRLLAYLLFLWIPFGFFTALETLDGPPELAVALVGGAGVIAFLYANRWGLRHLFGFAALAFICALWYWGWERGGAFGAVLALAATAGILFWLSGRSGEADAPDQMF